MIDVPGEPGSGGPAEPAPADPSQAPFPSTRWSLVSAAVKDDDPRSREALELLCKAYWPPLYAFVRKRGFGEADAQDLTQGFFTRLLEKKALRSADRKVGRFRTFLLASCRNYLANEWDRARAEKRGGFRAAIPFDFGEAEGSYLLEPSHGATPEALFEKQWALTVLERTLERLGEDYAGSGKAGIFERLRGFLAPAGEESNLAEAAVDLDMTGGAVKTAVCRMRQRYRALLREEIAQTVSSEEDVEEELRALFAALGSGNPRNSL